MTEAVAARGRRSGKFYLMIAPALLLSGVVVLIPGVLTAVAAFTDWDGLGLHPAWVGLANFREIFADPVFRHSLRDNLVWTALFLTIPVVIGLLTAMLLLRRKRTRTVYQVIYLIPYVLAPITNAVLWLNIIYNPLSGVIGFFRNHGSAIDNPLASTNTALYAVAGVDIWHFWGFLTVVYLAALRQTPLDQVEAALVEGANGWQIFRYVYLPSIRPTLQLMWVMIIIFSFLAFDYVYLLTQGGPANSTEMLSTYAYTAAFSAFQFGKAAAVGLVMSGFGLLSSFLFVWLSRKDSDL
ncbi:MAG TPA: sugar ABC transporter permease [Actinoplanes sp.]|jgi:raffinose/stachyose/melibiose transport system permease protein|nr:sugar ABC transporter permease [Actinoplanes sp.]